MKKIWIPFLILCLLFTGCKEDSTPTLNSVQQMVNETITYENFGERVEKLGQDNFFNNQDISTNEIKNYAYNVLNQIETEILPVIDGKSEKTYTVNISSIDMEEYLLVTHNDLLLRLYIKENYPNTYLSYNQTFQEYILQQANNNLCNKNIIKTKENCILKFTKQKNHWQCENADDLFKVIEKTLNIN